MVTGGYARAESYELVGPLAEASLAALNLDIVFLGTDGIDARAGLTTHHEVEAHTNLALIERARTGRRRRGLPRRSDAVKRSRSLPARARCTN